MDKCLWLFPLDAHSANHQPPSDPALCILFFLTNSLHVFFHPINLQSGLPAGLPPASSNLRVLPLIYSLHLLCTRPNHLSLASPASSPKHVALSPPSHDGLTPDSIHPHLNQRQAQHFTLRFRLLPLPGHERVSKNIQLCCSRRLFLPLSFHPC